MSSIKHDGSTQFNHATKENRLPRKYKDIRKILKDVKGCKGNLNNVVYSCKRLREGHKARIFYFLMEMLENIPLIDHIIQKLDLLAKEPYLQRDVAQILIHELLSKNGLSGSSSLPILAILKYAQEIKKEYNIAKSKINKGSSGVIVLPKYVRINSLSTTLPDVVSDLKQHGFEQISYDPAISFDEFQNMMKVLRVHEFAIDYHFKDVLVFSSCANLSKWQMYLEYKVFIHDKSSYLPVHALDPKPGCAVIDACAAPGMKTQHIIARMENSGKVFAYEMDQFRYKTLYSLIAAASGTKICKLKCTDFKTVNVQDQQFFNLDYILVDPTCSGSGMVKRMGHVTDTAESKDPERLKKLSGYQIILLKHALRFPSVQRVVYSTCSIHEQENECVVRDVLNAFSDQFKLVEVMPEWPIRGFKEYPFGELCIRAGPKTSLTNGFFVAMFERLSPDEIVMKRLERRNNPEGNVELERRNNPEGNVELERRNNPEGNVERREGESFESDKWKNSGSQEGFKGEGGSSKKRKNSERAKGEGDGSKKNKKRKNGEGFTVQTGSEMKDKLKYGKGKEGVTVEDSSSKKKREDKLKNGKGSESVAVEGGSSKKKKKRKNKPKNSEGSGGVTGDKISEMKNKLKNGEGQKGSTIQDGSFKKNSEGPGGVIVKDESSDKLKNDKVPGDVKVEDGNSKKKKNRKNKRKNSEGPGGVTVEDGNSKKKKKRKNKRKNSEGPGRGTVEDKSSEKDTSKNGEDPKDVTLKDDGPKMKKRKNKRKDSEGSDSVTFEDFSSGMKRKNSEGPEGFMVEENSSEKTKMTS